MTIWTKLSSDKHVFDMVVGSVFEYSLNPRMARPGHGDVHIQSLIYLNGPDLDSSLMELT